jgi:hypothetical protein
MPKKAPTPNLNALSPAKIFEHFQKAIKNQDLAKIELILNLEGFNPGYKDGVALIAAIKSGNTAIVKCLSEHPDINLAIKNNTPLKLACKLGQLDIVTLLLSEENKKRGVSAFLGNLAPLEMAVKNNHHEVVQFLIDNMKQDIVNKNKNDVILSQLLNNKLNAYQYNHYFENKIISIFQSTIKKADKPSSVILLSYPLSLSGMQRLFDWAIKHNYADVIGQLILKSENLNWLTVDMAKQILFNPETNEAALTKIIDNKKLALAEIYVHAYTYSLLPLVKILLDHPKIDPNEAYFGRAPAIGYAATHNLEELAKILLAHPKVDPSVHDNRPIIVAAQENHFNMVKLLADKIKIHKLPLLRILSSDVNKLCEEVIPFFENPSDYIKNNLNINMPRLTAFKQLELENFVKKREIEQRNKQFENEGAMNDDEVLRSMHVYKNKIKPFAHPLLHYTNIEEKKQAILRIEKRIRDWILEAILASHSNLEVQDFINKNKAALVLGDDPELMKQARENYFNSKDNPAHLAWRGYDKDAPYLGHHYNLLTDQFQTKPVFSTQASVNRPETLLNTKASWRVRKMVASYALLVTDSDKEEIIASRKANFIAELADFRSAHSEDYSPKGDAPSCYPGYIGRMPNLGLDHPLTEQYLSNKLIIKNFLETRFFTVFKSELNASQTREQAENLLASLSLLSITGWRAENIWTEQEVYSDALWEIRQNFITKLGTVDELKALINKELATLNRTPLIEGGEINETSYIEQYLLDPARGNLYGRFANEYQCWVSRQDQSQSFASPNPKLMPQSVALSVINPYSTKISLIAKFAEKNPVYKNQFNNLKSKQTFFEEVSSFLCQEKFIILSKEIEPSFRGLIENMTEAYFELNSKENLKSCTVFLNNVLLEDKNEVVIKIKENILELYQTEPDLAAKSDTLFNALLAWVKEHASSQSSKYTPGYLPHKGSSSGPLSPMSSPQKKARMKDFN